MARVVIFAEKLYQDLELWYPYYRLKEAGHEVIVAGPEAGKTYEGKYGYPVKTDVSCSELSADTFDAVVIPGGFAPDYMRRNPNAVPFIKTLYEQGGIVAAICHGVWLLASAEIIEDKRVTSFFAIKDDVVHAGGEWEDSETVVDGRIITARKPDDLPSFLKAVLQALEERK